MNTKNQLGKFDEGIPVEVESVPQPTVRPMRRGVVAWTGGSRPARPSEVGAMQAGLQKYLFAEQVVTFRGYWGDSPDWATLRTFFGRARYDAHATFRR